MTPLLSICIPTHDGRAAALAVALDSVLGQLPAQIADVEIVVCDNASQDATTAVVAQRARREDRLLLRAFGRHFHGDPRFWLLTLPALLAPHPVAKLAHRLLVRER